MTTTSLQFDDLITKINKYGYYDGLITDDKTVTDIIDAPRITSLTDMVHKQIDTILAKASNNNTFTFINKPDILTTDEMAYLQKYIIDKVYWFKSLAAGLAMSDLRYVHNYLSTLLKLADNTQNPSSCDIISLYVKYSHLIHLLVAFYDKTIIKIGDRDMFPKGNLNLSENYIFTRCFASANTIKYLLGGNTKNSSATITSRQLKDLIISLKHVPSYYLNIGVNAMVLHQGNPDDEWDEQDQWTWTSNFGHVFVLIKYKDDIGGGTGEDYYYLAQSYFHQYCPKVKKYNQQEILQMIDDITSIYFYTTGQPRIGEWTQTDNDIWMKYFLSDEKEFIGKDSFSNSPIKVRSEWGNYDCYCFEYDYNIIDVERCYKYIADLLEFVEKDVVNCFDNICRTILNACGIYTYERPFVITAIKNNKFAKVDSMPLPGDERVDVLSMDDSVLEKYRIPRENMTIHDIAHKYPLRLNWRLFESQLTKQNVMFIINKFHIKGYKQLVLLLSILVQFFELRDDVIKKSKNYGSNSHLVVTEHFGGRLTYYDRYIENKKDYLYLNKI